MGPLKGPSGHSLGHQAACHQEPSARLCRQHLVTSLLLLATLLRSIHSDASEDQSWVSSPNSNTDKLYDPRQGDLAFGPWVPHQKNNKNNKQTDKHTKNKPMGKQKDCYSVILKCGSSSDV